MKTTRSRPNWKKIGVYAGIGILGAVALMLIFDKILMPWYVKRGEVSILPKVVGMSSDKAFAALKTAGYEPLAWDTLYDDKLKEGMIIRQTPEGGDETKPGRKVYLIISGGKEMVVMPNLVGKNLRDARIMLVRANLDVGKTDMEFTDSIPAGTVFKQSPEPGKNVTTSQKIDLIVSQGSRAGKVAVPDLTGLSAGEATIRLGNLKLAKGNETESERPEGKPGSIYDQAPKPGELVLEGSAVDIFIVKEVVKNDEEH
jgi:beta-lactam-binding protein with PASTA domain